MQIFVNVVTSHHVTLDKKIIISHHVTLALYACAVTKN
jgi:hypothetical protein